jgi:hypothetical protein
MASSPAEEMRAPDAARGEAGVAVLAASKSTMSLVKELDADGSGTVTGKEIAAFVSSKRRQTRILIAALATAVVLLLVALAAIGGIT